MSEFEAWPKIPRFFDSALVISEKLDGTNGQILIEEDLKTVHVGSRNRWLSHHEDNFGFWNWVEANKEEIIETLGEGRHYGEWWGKGIQRGYNMDRKVFSLFNTHRWGHLTETDICDVVPHMEAKLVDKWDHIIEASERLFLQGSLASKKYGVSFDNPEGYMIYHARSNQVFKVPTNK